MIKLVSASNPPVNITVKGHNLSRGNFVTVAGPCCFVDYDELLDIVTAQQQQLGINIFRAGTYKLRTSPYSYQGLGEQGLELIARVAAKTGTVSLSEVTRPEDVLLMAQYVDILMVGTRNMYNYPLLQELGNITNPVVLKRGMSATMQEWLAAAEYLALAGNPQIILCERGIRTFCDHTRFTLDVAAIPAAQQLTCLPVWADPSHAGGTRALVAPLARAAVAAGADGLLLETHLVPDDAACDSQQAIDLPTLKAIIQSI